jgi:plasmid stabilization system protein ParE
VAKRVIWTETAKNARRDILKFWILHNKSNTYSKKLARLFRSKISLIAKSEYLGKPTDNKNVRVTLVSHFSIFYKVLSDEINIVGIWDNRRNPDDLHKNLEL